MKRRKFGVVLMLCGLLFVILAALLAFNNYIVDTNAGKSAKRIVVELQEKIDNAEEDKDSFEINGNEYIGILSIPAIDLKLPVMNQWDYIKLKTAPCRYFGAVETNDLVIAAHNYKNLFGSLHNLQIDDSVYFIDAAGVEHSYLVGDIEYLRPTDTKKMIESDWDLTLYTCNYSLEKRVTIRCRETNKINNINSGE